jgi:DNA (cytosine-5)-methyltransferase 1
VAEALAGLPLPTAKKSVDDVVRRPYPKTRSWSSYAESLRNPDGTVSGCARTTHLDATVKRFRSLGPGEVDSETSCRRLEGDGQALALRAGTREGTACRPVHPTQPRVITVREAARLHSYPDWVDFSPVVSQAHVQIGNSVPPRMASWLGAGLMQYLQSEPSPREQVAGVA